MCIFVLAIMLTHIGRKRNYWHNVRLASLLCLTAGFVNVAGLSGFFVLTTNVTGHAAVFAQRLSHHQFGSATVVGLWMLLFFAGAFCSSLYIGKVGVNNRAAYTIPILAEIAILIAVGTLGKSFDRSVIKTEYFAGSLLFAMGMQNALVTMISGFDVRTTHLTGMFTDLGIDTSSYLYESSKRREVLQKKILLRIIIITFFLLGGVLGGYIFDRVSYHTFYIPAGILVVVMFYDSFSLQVKRILHNLRYTE